MEASPPQELASWPLEVAIAISLTIRLVSLESQTSLREWPEWASIAMAELSPKISRQTVPNGFQRGLLVAVSLCEWIRNGLAKQVAAKRPRANSSVVVP